MPHASEFADRLKQARERAGLTQAQLAEAAGVHSQTITEYEGGRLQPREKRLKALAGALGVTAGWLRYGTGESHAGDSPGAQVPTPPRVMQGLPRSVRIWLQQELLDYAQHGVSDEELRLARDLYERPEVFSFYAGGVPTARSDEEVMIGLRAQAAAVRAILRRRGYELATDTPF